MPKTAFFSKLKTGFFHSLQSSCYFHVKIRSMGEKCPNTEIFLVRIFLYLDWKGTTGKDGPEKSPCLDTFHAVVFFNIDSSLLPLCPKLCYTWCIICYGLRDRYLKQFMSKNIVGESCRSYLIKQAIDDKFV